jgi:hypothetical protein
MKLGLLFAFTFVVVGMVAFALLAPLIFRGADFERLGRAVGPFILIVGGACGFYFGYQRQRKRESQKEG